MSKPCPICNKPATAAHKPFCSKRCTQLDLGKWLNGAYAIPSEEEPDEVELQSLYNEERDQYGS